MVASTRRVRVRAAAVAACLAALVIGPGAASAGPAASQGFKAPRNAYGQPDFSGIWTNASLTQLERPPQVKSLVITPAQARTLEAWWILDARRRHPAE